MRGKEREGGEAIHAVKTLVEVLFEALEELIFDRLDVGHVLARFRLDQLPHQRDLVFEEAAAEPLESSSGQQQLRQDRPTHGLVGG